MDKITSRAIIGYYFFRLAQMRGMSWVDSVSMLFNSDQASETYAWLGQVPGLTEWIGSKKPKGLSENDITIVNKDYEATIEFFKKELRRDKTGQIQIRIADLARKTVKHDMGLLSSLILNGAAGVCYDGSYFFAADHAEGSSGTQSNLSTSAIVLKTAPTAAEMANTIYDVIVNMIAVKDDQGDPMNEEAMDFLVMVPPKFTKAANSAIVDQVIVDGSVSRTNTLTNSQFKISVATNPRLSDWTDSFAVFRTDADVKALIRQIEADVVMKAIADGSELEFNEGKHRYGVEKTGGAGYGLWQLGQKHVFTTA